MLTRAITGVFFIAVLISALLFGAYSFSIFFALVGLGALYEFYGLIAADGSRPNVFLGMLCAVVLSTSVICYLLGYAPIKVLTLCIPLVALIFIVGLFGKRAAAFVDLGYSLLGIVYACVPFLFFIALGFLGAAGQGISSYNYYIPMGFLIMLWSNDTGAYLSGRLLGRRKLFERISPNKTWEGFFGGVMLAVLVSFALFHFFGTLPMALWVLMAVVIGVFGTLGDLVESMLKRSLGVKDSGRILPGHGGFLDRFDGLLIGAPLVYVLLLMCI